MIIKISSKTKIILAQKNISAPRLLGAIRTQGNVRELENIIEHAMVMCNTEEIIIEHLPVEFLEDENNQTLKILPEEPLQKTECQAILESLTKHDWNKNKVAEELKVHRSTLWRKMKRHGMV